MDVSVTLDGRPHNAVFDEQVKQVLDAADTDKDGRPTWKELATNDKYLADGQPNRPPISANQLKTLIERYDENRDGQVQPREAMSWLGRNTETSAHAFEVRSTRVVSAQSKGQLARLATRRRGPQRRIIERRVGGGTGTVLVLRRG